MSPAPENTDPAGKPGTIPAFSSLRFEQITGSYSRLRVAVVGDFCLDRYLEIDPAKQETSLETGLPVYNVINVRAQAGGAGTILNNLAALGIGTIYPIGLAGDDGEGFELLRALQKLEGVRLDFFDQTPLRRTFTYCKPLMMVPEGPPVELNRLDSKNWTPTPRELQEVVVQRVRQVSKSVDAMILLDQVDVPETGVISALLLESLKVVQSAHPQLPILADSRRGLEGYPPVIFKMNGRELSALSRSTAELSLAQARQAASALACRNGRHVFVTLAEQGILGAGPKGEIEHVPALPIRGEIDIVGAGDAVTANLAAALAADATLREGLQMATVAASIVIHKLGTTGTASVPEIAALIGMKP